MDAQMKQRVFTGVVTQLQEHYGMVDQDVRFQRSVVKGRIPALGERVLVKAVLDPSQPHSWTAQRVQSLNEPFKCPPPLLPSITPGQKQGILGSKPQPLLKSPKIPPLIPSMLHSPAKPGLLQTPSWGGQFDGWGRGTRKRHAETGRRGDRREDNGPWGGDQKRRRWKEGTEEEGTEESGHPKKTNPVPPQSPALFSCFPRDCVACDSLELQRRYPHLSLPPSVCHLSISWIDSFPPSQPLPFPLLHPCLYLIGSPQPDGNTPTERESSEYTVKVLLLSMPSSEELYRLCCGLQDQADTLEGTVHPTSLVKFLLGDVGGELRLLGGPWCPQADGGSPVKDPQALLKTAVRCVREQSGLDLSGCSQWYKMAELKYVCEGKVETVVFLLPDVWRIVPTEEEWDTLRTKDQEEKEASLPAGPCLVVKPSPGLALCPVSLSSLLVPHSSQTKEAFEVGLLAELFSEMLQRDFGLQLYRCLCSLHPSHAPMEDEQIKKNRKQRTKARDGRSRKGKSRGKKAEDTGEETDDDGEEMEEEETEEEKDREGEMLGEEGMTCDNSDTILKQHVLSRKVLLACVFFDRQLSGSLRETDLQNILLSLGLCLTPAQVQELVSKVLEGGCFPYRKLASRLEEPEHPEPDINMEGNRGLLHGVPVTRRAGSRRAAGSVTGAEVVSYKGGVVNIPSLLQALERADRTRQGLELRIAALQDTLVETETVTQGQGEELNHRLERAEIQSSTYKKKLKEDTGHMIALIQRMQEMVDKTTSLTESKTEMEDEEQ